MAEIVKRYYSLAVDGETADLYIFGDITSWEWLESDVSSYTLAKQLQGLSEEVTQINIHINSYGGDVAEGLGIYNALRGHKAKVTTYCQGFACSAASVVFMAGDERIMSDASLLMIHNVWAWLSGDANDLRKQADDLDTINQATVNAYMAHVSISEDEVKAMMSDETWILAEDAKKMGFATSVTQETKTNRVAAKVRQNIVAIMQDKPKNIPANKISVAVDLDTSAAEEKLKQLEARLGALMTYNKKADEPSGKPPKQKEPGLAPRDKTEKLTSLLSALFVSEKGEVE